MTSPLPAYNSVVASATVLKPQKSLSPQYDSWQEQLWDYYDTLGEFEAAVAWKANSLSRVRLLAAELSSSGEEPEPLTEGPAAEIMERFAGGTGGQAQLMREMVTHLSVPGEGWMVGEAGDPKQGAVEGEEHWFVASADELRVATKGGAFELKTGEGRDDWRQLSTNSMVVRVWQPHPRFGYQATSDARHAIGAMLELDLVNKRIIADITSRLASNGILLYDKERLSFGQTQNTPVPDDAEKPDPFAEQLVAVASRGIQDAMSPEAVIPLPIGYSLGEGLSGIDPKLLMQHITFGGGLDPKLLDQRDAAIKRLATNLDIPADVLLGLGDMNHWSAWNVEESGIKIHIAPTAELISFSLTAGYLRPMLQSQKAPLIGPNGNPVVVWYDPSEITVRPDRSQSTIAAFDRFEVPGRVLRRELGLSEEADEPTPEELQVMIGRWLARQPATALTALANMSPTGAVKIDGAEDVVPTGGAGAGAEAGAEEQPAETDTGGTDLPDQPAAGEAPPAAASLDIGELTNERLIEFATLANDELIRRRGPVSTWVDAEEPNVDALRKPRNGNRAEVS